MSNYKAIIFILIFTLLFIPNNLYPNTIDVGGGEHYKNILIGDRAATMGGAFNAISDDASGVYYNPAGLVYIPYSTFSGSANTLHKIKMTYKNAIGKFDWVRDSLSIKPNFFSLVNKQSDNFVWGISYVVPKSRVEDQHEVFLKYDSSNNDFFFNYHDEDTTTYIGPSVSYKLSDSMSIGMTLYYFFRDRKYQANQLILDENNKIVQWLSQDREVTVNGFQPILGIMWTPIEKVSLGATVRTHGIKKSTWNRNFIHYSGETDTITTNYKVDSKYPIEYPVHFTLGAAYFFNHSLLISGDIDYYHILESKFKKVVNTSFGIEYFLTQNQAIRFGYYTNNTNVPKPSSETNSNRSVNMTGLTAGYTIYGPTNYLTFGTIYSSGKGKAQVSVDSALIDYDRSDLSFIISAGFGF